MCASRLFSFLLLKDLALNVLRRVGPFCREPEKRDSRRCECLVHEIVPCLSLCFGVALVVEFDNELNGQIVRATGDEVEMLALNLIEGRLPRGAAHAALDVDDVGKSDLAEDAVVLSDGLLKHAEEGALSGGEEGVLLLIRIALGRPSAGSEDVDYADDYGKEDENANEWEQWSDQVWHDSVILS